MELRRSIGAVLELHRLQWSFSKLQWSSSDAVGAALEHHAASGPCREFNLTMRARSIGRLPRGITTGTNQATDL